VDILKLDKAFLDNFDVAETGQKEKTIVSHIISMAKALDMEVLAEGVESKSQKDFLLSANCDMIQGYYYAKPMKLEHFDRELRYARAKVSQA
jgi:EAL domain-containing protein (putative c-di-GMP-specific phosphodiesterase class I)